MQWLNPAEFLGKVRGDLVEALQRLVRIPGLDAIVVELSGMADVGPVAQTFFSPTLQSSLQLDAIVCVCDTGRLEQLLLHDAAAEESPERELVMTQLSLADRVILNKVDTSRHMQQLVEWVQGIKPGLELLQCDHGEVPPAQLLGLDCFSLEATIDQHQEFGKLIDGGHHHHHHPHTHTRLGFGSVGVVESDRPISWVASRSCNTAKQ